jgi:hypothetical protein
MADRRAKSFVFIGFSWFRRGFSESIQAIGGPFLSGEAWIGPKRVSMTNNEQRPEKTPRTLRVEG